MIIEEEINKEGNERVFRNKELQQVLKQYPDNALVMFQDFTFNSSKKQLIKDIVFREEIYPNHEKKGASIIFISEYLNLGKSEEEAGDVE